MSTLAKSAKSTILTILVAVSTLSVPAAWGEAIEGELQKITREYVTVNGKSFSLAYSGAQCRDETGTRLTCDTLIGVGYADRVRVTISGGVAIKVDVLKMSQ